MMVPISYRLYDYNGTPTPTLEQYTTTRMKTEIFGIKREIWRSWRQNSQLLREAENTELRAQIFFDDLFDSIRVLLCGHLRTILVFLFLLSLCWKVFFASFMLLAKCLVFGLTCRKLCLFRCGILRLLLFAR